MMRPRHARVLGLTTGLVALATACSGASATPVSRTTAPADSSRSASPDLDAEPEVALPTDVRLLSDQAPGAALEPGRYAGEFVVGARPRSTPLAVVQVPPGYAVSGPGEVVADDGNGFRHLALWTVAKVANDACPRTVDFRDPGPTARDLAVALRGLHVWRSSEPMRTTVGGYPGLAMDFDLPDPLPAGCSEEPYHWVDDELHTQGVAAGKHQRLWIVDVEGARVMIVAGWFPPERADTRGPSHAVRQLLRMAETVTFLTPAA